MSKLEIEQVLVLSTSHVSEKTVVLLPRCASDHDENSEPPMWWPKFTREEGWLFHVTLEPGWFDERYGDAPGDVRACAMLARDNGCCWLMLDQDGPVVDLPTFEW